MLAGVRGVRGMLFANKKLPFLDLFTFRKYTHDFALLTYGSETWARFRRKGEGLGRAQ